jgi:hypothetical protein
VLTIATLWAVAGFRVGVRRRFTAKFPERGRDATNCGLAARDALADITLGGIGGLVTSDLAAVLAN